MAHSGRRWLWPEICYRLSLQCNWRFRQKVTNYCQWCGWILSKITWSWIPPGAQGFKWVSHNIQRKALTLLLSLVLLNQIKKRYSNTKLPIKIVDTRRGIARFTSRPDPWVSCVQLSVLSVISSGLRGRRMGWWGRHSPDVPVFNFGIIDWMISYEVELTSTNTWGQV